MTSRRVATRAVAAAEGVAEDREAIDTLGLDAEAADAAGVDEDGKEFGPLRLPEPKSVIRNDMECRVVVMSELAGGHPFPAVPHGEKKKMLEKVRLNLGLYRASRFPGGLVASDSTLEKMVNDEILAYDTRTKACQYESGDHLLESTAALDSHVVLVKEIYDKNDKWSKLSAEDKAISSREI